MFAVLLTTLWLDAVDIERHAADLLHQNGVIEDFESAPFLVREEGGRVAMIRWPAGHRYRTAKWSGTIPKGTFAVIHTHPVRAPRPSSQDIAEARRTKLSMFVVTRNSLCVADTAGAVECSFAVVRRAPVTPPEADQTR